MEQVTVKPERLTSTRLALGLGSPDHREDLSSILLQLELAEPSHATAKKRYLAVQRKCGQLTAHGRFRYRSAGARGGDAAPGNTGFRRPNHDYLVGRPAELAARALPGRATGLVAKAAETALTRALDIALFSLRDPRLRGGRVVHSALASASGAIGGAFGLSALTIELPVSTAIMLRAIAAIARSEGEDLADPATGLACLEVFGLGAFRVRPLPKRQRAAISRCGPCSPAVWRRLLTQ